MEEIRKWPEAFEAGAEEAQPVEAAEDALDAPEARMADMLDELKADMEAKLKAALDEAVRVSAMSPEEKAAHNVEGRLKGLEEREKALERREMRAEALEKLAAIGLPAGLADAVNCEDRGSMERSIQALDGAFREAVRLAVEERLRGAAPAAGASAQDAGDDLDDADYYRLREGLR